MFSNKQSKQIVLIGMLLCVGILVGGVSPVQAQTDYSTAPDCSTVSYNGSGTSSDPYQVDDPYTLQCITTQSLSSHYIQTSDINMSVTNDWNGGSGFRTIGMDTSGNFGNFGGHYDGNNHSIEYLYIDWSGKYVGLFSNLNDNSNVKNIAIYNSYIENTKTEAGTKSTGMLAGRIEGTVNNTVVSGQVVAEYGAGGMADTLGERGTVKNSYAVVDVLSKQDDAGGMFGYLVGANLENVYSIGSVNGAGSVGPVIGFPDGTSGVKDVYFDQVATGFNTGATNTVGLSKSVMRGSSSSSNMPGFDFTNNWTTVDANDGYTADSFPILQSLNKTQQLSAQSISTVSNYDLTVNIDHNGTDVDTDYEILDDTDSVVASGNTGTDGQVVQNLEEGTYEVQLAYSDDQYSNITKTVTLDAGKTVDETLSLASYDLTVNVTNDVTAINTTYDILDSSNTVVASGTTGSDGQSVESVKYGSYDIEVAYDDPKYGDMPYSITVDSDITANVDIDIAEYDLTINTTETGSTAGVNVSYNVTQNGSTATAGYTDGETTQTINYGTYNISVANASTYVENTTEVVLGQNETVEFDLVEKSSDTVVVDSGNDGQSGLFASLGFIGSVFTGLVAVLTIGGIAFGIFRSKVM